MTTVRAIKTSNLGLATASLLAIAEGVLTITGSHHAVDVEDGAASSDDLDTITGGEEGQLVVLRPYSDARSIVVKHGTGNIECPQGVDITLAEDDDVVVLVKCASKWSVVSFKTKASRTFMSVPITGTGSEQTVAHGMGIAPRRVWWALKKGHNGSGATGDKVPDIDLTAVPDATNIKLSCTAGAEFYLYADA